MDLAAAAHGIPKAELHVHIEGTLEPDLMFALADRNGLTLPYRTVEDLRSVYRFADLQSFLDLYYRGAAALRTERDFHDLAWAYLERAAADNVRRVEMFFDPQTHLVRGVGFDEIIGGLHRAGVDAEAELGVSTALIMCFLRHLPAGEAMATLEMAMEHRELIVSVGLDSSEVGHPSGAFAAVFDEARQVGLRLVAHAGEEGPPRYVWEALDVLGVERVDHGVRAMEDASLVRRLADEGIPLTVCPLSNVALQVVDNLSDHVLPAMLDAGLMVSVHSDDPAYFGGYIGDNYAATVAGLGFGADEIGALAANSFRSCFLPDATREALISEVDDYVAAAGSAESSG